MVKIEEIPRAALRSSLQLTRLPLTAFEAVARRGQDNDGWGPALLFERYEVSVKELVGGLVNDEELLTQARLQRAKLDQLQRAARLEGDADRKSAEASREFQARQQAAEERRQQVERQAAEREAQLERDKQQAKRKVQQELAEKREAADRVEKARERTVERQQTAADRKRLDAEAAALADKERALKAKGQAIDLDKEMERTKARRKSNAS